MTVNLTSDLLELERAIKESLLEAERVKTKPNVTNFSNKEPSPYESARFSSNPEQPSYNRQSSHTEPPTLLTSKPSYDLTPTQLSNISLFATLVQTQSHEIAAKGYENFNPHQLQTLFAQVASLHSQLTSCVQEAAEGYKELYEMNELLNEVIGVYETYNQQKMLYNGKGQFAYAPQGNSTGYTQQSGYSGGYASQGNPTGAYASPPNTTGYPPQQIAQGYTQEPIRQQDYNPQVPVQAMPYAPHQSSNALQEFISQMPLQGQPYPVQQNTPPHGYAPQAQTQGSPFSPPSQSFPNQHYPQGNTIY